MATPPPSLDILRQGFNKTLEGVDHALSPALFSATFPSLSSAKCTKLRDDFLSQWRTNCRGRFEATIAEAQLPAKLAKLDSLLHAWPASAKTGKPRAPYSQLPPAEQLRRVVISAKVARKRMLEIEIASLEAQIASKKVALDAVREAALASLAQMTAMQNALSRQD